jgi:branched-chain amino acid transport system permease protein
LLPEALRFVGMPNSVAANMRQMIYGVRLSMAWFLKMLVKNLYFGRMG